MKKKILDIYHRFLEKPLNYNNNEYIYISNNNINYAIKKSNLNENEIKVFSEVFRNDDKNYNQKKLYIEIFINKNYDLILKLPIKKFSYTLISINCNISFSILNDIKTLLNSSLERDSVISIDKNTLIIFREKSNEDTLLSEVIEAIITDFMINISVYHSKEKQYTKSEIDNLHIVLNLFLKTSKHQATGNIDEIKLLKVAFEKSDRKYIELQKQRLDKIDNELTLIAKTYLKNGMNHLKTANELYIHRNTLHKRLDEFVKVTEYNIRSFKDATLLYMLIA